jgi:hypothetical protein
LNFSGSSLSNSFSKVRASSSVTMYRISMEHDCSRSRRLSVLIHLKSGLYMSQVAETALLQSSSNLSQ